MNIHHPMTHFKILLQHMFKGRFSTFSLTTPNKEWIFLLPEMTSVLWWTLSLLIWFTQIWCSEHWWQQHMQWWWLLRTWSYTEWALGNDFIPFIIEMYGCLHSHFDSFFYHLYTNHYHVSSTIFFSPLDVHFPLSIMCVLNPTTCVSHNNFLASCCIWSGFFIFSTYHSYCIFVISRFVVDDSFFVLGFLCYHWLSFHSPRSHLHGVLFTLFFVDCLFLFF